MNKYSITSNEVKMFKHLDSLSEIQAGYPSPVTFHVSPTNACNLSCEHCCFSEREKGIELPYPVFRKAMNDMAEAGAKSLEFTGGGEPTLYTRINDAICCASRYFGGIGMCTNALSIDKVSMWELLDWVRVSLNILDDNALMNRLEENVKTLKNETKVTACYVASNDFSLEQLKKVAEFANQHSILTRIAPDCIQTKEKIRFLVDRLGYVLEKNSLLSEYIFLSEFNVYLWDRENDHCWLHALKPFLYSDGWVYDCPSSELAMENNRTMQPEFRVCKAEEIRKFYRRPLILRHHSCSYCKYARQNDIIDTLVMETENNEFC